MKQMVVEVNKSRIVDVLNKILLEENKMGNYLVEIKVSIDRPVSLILLLTFEGDYEK